MLGIIAQRLHIHIMRETQWSQQLVLRFENNAMFKLVDDIEKHYEDMQAIVAEIRAKKGV